MSNLRVNTLQSLTTGKQVSVDSLESAGVKIAVIGDSLSTENALFNKSWPSKFEQYLNQSGVPATVYNYSVNGVTFNQVGTDQNFGSLTALDAAISQAPNVVYVSLGFNDTVNRSEDRTATQIINDAEAVFDYLRAGLPDAVLIWANIISYDIYNSNVASLTNRNVIPHFYNFRSTGTLSGLISPEVMGDSISAYYQTGFDRYAQVVPGITGLASVDDVVDIDYFRIARLGLTGWDRLHPSNLGSLMMAGYVVANSEGSPALAPYFANIADKLYPEWNDPDPLFEEVLTWNGTDYDRATSGLGNFEQIRRLTSGYSNMNPDVWYYSNKASLVVSDDISANGVFSLGVNGASPDKEIFPTDASNASSNSIGTTSSRGDAAVSSFAALAEGTSVVYYRIGNEHYGPFTIEVAAGNTYADRPVNLTLLNGWTADPTFSSGTIRARKTLTGQVYLEGAINGSTATDSVFVQLPAGYRPGWATGHAVAMNGAATTISVLPDGLIEAPAGWGSGTILFLDNVMFKAV